jgi:hypothetical protein
MHPKDLKLKAKEELSTERIGIPIPRFGGDEMLH